MALIEILLLVIIVILIGIGKGIDSIFNVLKENKGHLNNIESEITDLNRKDNHLN